jgi:DNA-binding MarR family transcriptional regulator
VDRSNQYPGTGLGALLPRLGDYILLRLMELTKAKGHPGLKMSFAQVLTLIGESGGRIQQIAKVQHVSKQAISAIASEAEALGYLQRHPDPADARQLVLRFTARGRSLIEDSVASVDELEAEFVAIAGKPGIDRLKSTFADLYCALHLEQDIFDNSAPNNIGELAQQIQQQLGSDRSRELARLLLSPGNNRS